MARPRPIRRARLAWTLAGCSMAVGRRDWPRAASLAVEALRLIAAAAAVDGRLSEVGPIYRDAGAARLLSPDGTQE